MLAIIPARGGSKGIPNKNIVSVAGKPMIVWTIESAMRAKCFDKIVVSTDSPQIAGISKKYGAEVPFIRPAELAQDTTPGIDVLLHTLAWLKENTNYCPEIVMLLQPTSPLRTSQDILNAIKIFNDRDADAVVSVCQPKHHPSWMKTIAGDGRLIDYSKEEKIPHQRQLLSDVYALNGAIYIARRDVIMKKLSFFTENTYPYIMSSESSIDVDELMDINLAEAILKGRSNV